MIFTCSLFIDLCSVTSNVTGSSHSYQSISYQSIKPERFKTPAAHFPIQRDGRTGMQRATLGKSGSEAASQLQGRIARTFSSNNLVNTMDMTAAIQYTLTAAQSLGSQVYYKKCRMTILGLAGVLFCKNEQA